MFNLLLHIFNLVMKLMLESAPLHQENEREAVVGWLYEKHSSTPQLYVSTQSTKLPVPSPVDKQL